VEASHGADRTIGRYRIEGKLGQGGMGVVYRAFDSTLQRAVALKVLPAERLKDPSRRRRFEQEARSASSISHGHVAHIYEVGESEGESFIAMEFVEGETLERILASRRLDIREVLRIAVQMVDALDAAHARGIVHRDIKPGNIMITPRGEVKVLDFGLARVSQPEEPAADDTTALTNTTPGTILGTGPYMSPEQALGREVDHRSDIFSVGAVLYEMVTGKRAFAGATFAETLMKVVQSDIEPVETLAPGIPPGLAAVIGQCLAKDRDKRYQKTADLLDDLRSIQSHQESTYLGKSGVTLHTSKHSVLRRPGSGFQFSRRTAVAAGAGVAALGAAGAGWWLLARRPRFESLAVMPFVNQTKDVELEYLSDGLAESVINRVSQLRGLTVLSRSSTFSFKNKPVEVNEVARRLGVDAVLTGSVVVREGMLRVSAELTEAATGRHLWGEQYTRPASNAFLVQEQIAQEIAARLRADLTGEEREQMGKRFTDSGEAYRLFLKGRYHWNKRGVENLKLAIQFFSQAIELDPTYALAYSGMADCYMLLGNVLKPEEAFGKARAAANRALEIDANLAEPYATLGFIALHYEFDWAGAEKNLRRSSELNPNYPSARSVYARYLMAMGRYPESVQEVSRALQLDPLSQGVMSGIGLAHYYARRYDEAIAAYRKALELDRSFVAALLNIGDAYVQKRQFSEAFASFDKALSISASDAVGIGQRGHAYAVAGRRAEALSAIPQLKKLAAERFVSPYAFALVYAGLNEAGSAVDYLERAYAERAGHIVFVNVEPSFDPLRKDPRFRSLVGRMRLNNNA
jgi:eukaryotic-like serine/threonine-protein kinase